MLKYRRAVLATGVATAAVAAWLAYRPDLALQVAVGVAAHDVCSKTFTSGLDPGAVLAETLTRDGIGWLRWGLRAEVDRPAGRVVASLAGLLPARALHRPGLGCVLAKAREPAVIDTAAISAARQTPALLPALAGPEPVAAASRQLEAALAQAFEEPPRPPLRRTKAVVIVKEDRIIAERYAPGVGPDTPLMGFSMTKSVVNALIGMLALDGRVSPSQPAAIGEWQGAGDARRGITIEHLMRMTSGLDADETNSGFDISSRILYLADDMGAAAARLPRRAPPDSRWHYSSPSTLLLSRIIREAAGGRAEDALAFAHRRLFGPLGMRTAVLETDATGAFIGSSYMFASARDWARLGMLYLNDGKIGGTRLLPEGWVDFSATSSLGTSYGAGFWTTRSEHAWARRWREGGLPYGAFFASGDLGQRIVIMPAQRLLVVRLGDAVDPTGDMQGTLRLVREVLAAVQSR
ncbi:MAG: serine hydrolase [Hyphomicrobiaceae bacterium]|nr:serine hydrolase [Hyphomicrobiaceae bacterium]